MKIRKEVRLQVIFAAMVIISSFIIAAIIPSSNADSESYKKIDILYSSTTCTSCQRLDRYLQREDIILNVLYIEKDREKFESDVISLPAAKLKDGTFLNGYDAVFSFLTGDDVSLGSRSSIGLLGVIFAAFIDSINPCAIASLIFILTYFKNNKTKKEVLKSGLIFSFTIFIVYFLIGFSILFLQRTFSSHSLFPIVLGVFVTFICSYGIYEGVGSIVKENLRCTGGICRLDNDEEGMAIKRKILNNKSVVITGIIVAIAEFACTGQVYIPTLALSGASERAFIYLVIYNIIFVLPIVLITILYGRISENDISNEMNKKKKVFMYLNLILFTGLLIFSINYYFL